MALTIKTIIKIYLLFFAFQICSNVFIEVVPSYRTLDSDNQNYINWLSDKVNGEIDTQETGNTLLSNFKGHLQTTDLFNEGIINAFLGVLKVIGSIIWFIVELALSILFTPSLMLQILLYNFIANTSY